MSIGSSSIDLQTHWYEQHSHYDDDFDPKICTCIKASDHRYHWLYLLIQICEILRRGACQCQIVTITENHTSCQIVAILNTIPYYTTKLSQNTILHNTKQNKTIQKNKIQNISLAYMVCAFMCILCNFRWLVCMYLQTLQFPTFPSRHTCPYPATNSAFFCNYSSIYVHELPKRVLICMLPAH